MIGKDRYLVASCDRLGLPHAKSPRTNLLFVALGSDSVSISQKGTITTMVKNREINAVILVYFRYTDGITYFFKGSVYYRFNDTTQAVDPGYPRSIASFWKGVPDNLDTVFSASNGHTYFFKENLFYRFNDTAGQVDNGYPKSIALWRGILYQT